MKLTMLGTGNAMVTNCYNTCFILEEHENYLLVDAGGGNTILSRLKEVKVDLSNIHDVIVTHKHIDHLLGVVWVLRAVCQAMNSQTYEGELNIYAHDEVIALLQSLGETMLAKKVVTTMKERVNFITVEDGETREIINHLITFFDIHSTKAKQFGFCMDLGDGEKLTCCGDEPCNNYGLPYATNSKWLLHEAFCLDSQADIFHPYEKHHSTAKDASELAEKLGVKNLLLYHTEDKNMANRKELYYNEGKAYFTGNLFIPDDMESLEL